MVKQNFGNDNRRKVNEDLENLLKAIFGQYWKPTVTDVWHDYNDFLSGKSSIVSQNTGEIYKPSDFEPVSESTIRLYLTKYFANKASLEYQRSGDKIKFNKKHVPFAKTITDFAGSLVSMDDRDLPFKLIGSRQRVKGYYAIDVASECFIGWAHSMDKKTDIVLECFRNMFEQLYNYGVNMPSEVEVERHLMYQMREGLLKSGELFTNVRFAAAQNPQEKFIENVFRRMRYCLERKNDSWIPRPFSKAEAYQTRKGITKLNEDGEYETLIKNELSKEEIIALEISMIEAWNNMPHPNKKYKGLSRREVYLTNQHPKLQAINWCVVARFLGKETKTTLSRVQFRCNYKDYILPSINLASKFENGSITCYSLWQDDRSEVFVYKNNEFVCQAIEKPVFHKAKIEQTEQDFKNMAVFQKYRKEFDDMIKEGLKDVDKVKIINNSFVEKASDKSEDVEIFPDLEQDFIISKTKKNSWKDKFRI